MAKFNYNILVFTLIGLFGSSAGQFVQLGQCDANYQLQSNFDFDEFLGQWYEISRSANPNLQGDCSSFTFSRTGTTNNVAYNAVSSNFASQVQGTATINSAQLTLTMPNAFDNPLNFWILLTDYETYAVAFSCENISTTQRQVYLWVLGRQNAFNNPMITALINTNINNLFGITSESLQEVIHSDDACYILPVIPTGQAVILPGQCDPNIPVVQDFNVNAFSGTWHVISSYFSENTRGACGRAQYTLGDNGVDVLNSQVINEALDSITGTASVASTDGSARLTVRLNVAPGVVAESDLYILQTDYTNFGVSYTCVNLANNQRQVFSWIISRTRRISDTAQTAVDQVVNSYVDLNYAYFEEVDQSDEACFYYPEPVFNQPVVFRGQCDLTIPAMTNFDAERYMGLWHNIELYPQAFQEGTCSNARYSLANGIVEVVNSQVVNQRLDVVEAFAVPVDEDEAKLEVTFPVAGTNLTVTSKYWVLDTDYDSYALVYSCFNVNEEEMQVTSWKLSRTKTLTAAANNIMTTLINGIKVLDQRYFQISDQSTEGCFYFPDARPGVPVVFPGQCDNNINAQANFNLQQFQGTWYEIQAYPKTEDLGQCINHAFTFGDSTYMNLITTSVIDQFLSTSNGVMTFNSATDTSGRLTITITTNDGLTVTIPYWVLATDYTDYALAYACINEGTDFRGIWSWKLSRSQQLSTAAVTAINNAIANIEVLDNVYYEDVDHSDQACFTLPEIEAGQPIILTGQCDLDITGVPNFSTARYAGRWRIVESYQDDRQVGTCNYADYTFASATSLTVQQSQVVNNELISVSGSAAVSSTDGTGRLLYTFPTTGETVDFIVLDTDYDSYALGYSCVNIGTTQKRVWSWKLSRGNTLSQTASENINRVIDNIEVLNNRYFQSVDRTESGCFYFPEAGDLTPVVFPGQCDETIPVMANFDAGRYFGLWHDIESYPMPFQDGTCPNALYSPNDDGTVAVYNTQVLSQSLDTQSGVATVVGNAKLSVNFIVQGIELISDYWILDTDYDSYSLVYSCRNVDAYYKSVAFWKLSRTKSLSATAVTNINAVMSTLDILDQRYFVNRDQSADGCFYYPEPQLGVPVVFPGQCDTTIAALPNFDMNLFQGVWYEIESYPKVEQSGQCINHQFTSGTTANTLNLVSSDVLNQALTTTSSTVTFSSTDSSGRLVITIVSGGQTIQIPYWILSTDYTDYALAYSCVNIDTDYRGVWSWKLSRTKQLSAAAGIAITSTIAPINVLDNVYYENIQQTDAACFYLPTLAANDPVVFPGQCDTNIRGIANFDITRYAGRWRIVESYQDDRQVGTCNYADYTFASATSLTVQQSQVVNNELISVSGSAAVSSTDGTGRLLYTFPTTGETIDVIILDTDYDSYALGYSCVNINSNERRVWSWKFSRGNTLSQAANENINRVIDTIEVLNDRYFQSVDRTESGCFYFPEAGDLTPVVFPGQCDQSIPVMANFDASRYFGLWHDIESYPMPFQDGTCPNALYSPNDDGTVAVYNTQVLSQSLDTQSGVATVVGNAKLSVNFVVQGIELISDYWILDTDYDSYSLVYSCRNLDAYYKSVAFWKLSRTKSLSATAVTNINAVMSTLDILDQRYFVNRDQSVDGCFYYPEPQLGVPVVFPGQCDTTIAAIPNFDMNLFQGVWHEIESYPKVEQSGQCINHQFTSGTTANTLNLVSSDVLNQALTTTSSSVSFSSTDSSGRLVITIVSGGQTIQIPYWILSTDYTDYALAYSCVNIDTDYRGVWSWKLSRTKQLSAAAGIAITSTIAPINVLDNVYYENIQQTDAACFYLPTLAANDPVVFPGQCDTNLQGIANFNTIRYAGRWRIVESYQDDRQVGTCNYADYTFASATSLTVQQSQVVNNELISVSGSAAVSSTDGTGRLLYTFPTTGETVDVIILDTDYDSYALGYSCVNINSNERRVWSWKFSRGNTLSQAANENINRVIDTIEVLNDRYFQSVDRTESGCFYFPEAGDLTPVVFPGQCDESIPVMANFDAARYFGLWHDIESYPMPFQDGTCPNALYSPNDDGTVAVYNTQVLSQSLDTQSGVATVVGNAKLSVNFVVQGIELISDYWILDTDYDSYSLVYSCRNVDAYYKSVAFWKLSRTKSLSATAVTNINAVMSTLDILDQRYFVNRDQSVDGCFYYPEPQLGVPVVFPGQCDTTIAAIPNFNMNLFQGVWHEIESYPKVEQSGQCVNHQFTSGTTANTLNLVSSDVLNQALTTTSSTVTFSSTDSSGRLVITLVSGGQTIQIPYWILSTDYTDFALAYSCVNLNDDYRGVWSWKLSKTKQLSAAANAAINIALSSINVLDNIYFENVNQNDDACFYLPDLGAGEPVIFPGQCDTNTPVVPNFSAGRYLGRWRLIETYPSAFQVGECNEATYTLSEDGLSVEVYNTEVVDQQLNVEIGTAVASIDGTGKLSVTFPNSGGAIDYYILDTDYDTYTLVYSCANINSEQRRVWSWKMSRTDTLSETAVANINQVVDSINVLNQRYYQSVVRTEAACFYYPTPNPESSVIFRGQCDPNIVAIPNFNANAYAGFWYDVESYPAPFQTGTCSNAQYTVNEDLSVNVVNTQVVNQVLETWVGSAVLGSTDNSGLLYVTFIVNGIPVTTNYYVLDTDYNSYAFVYSCRNIDSEYREVFSWKLSRTPTLTTLANNAIQAVMNNIEVLDQQYYIARGHTEDDCFYYPDNEGGDVILEGQCVDDAQVPAVTGFNANAFTGTWYEVARFPSTIQNGSCTSTQFTSAGTNSLNIVQTDVIDERQQSFVTQGSVATDGRGVISANIDGVPFTNVYILATDYNDYALAYSCRNLDSGSKQIYSWKFSRNQAGLSAAANAIIDQSVSDNIDLFEGYYEDTSQDTAACFHYPVFDELPETIELIGSCDTSIRGIANFNANAYLGIWFEIARYPQPDQFGQCSRAEYSQGEGRVNVFNSEVRDQTLGIQAGYATLASTDGSGQLDVVFEVNGVTRTSNYYILDTDYTNYALVYSCYNLPNGNRVVSSWKLSRTRTLSAAANNIMNSVIANTEGLIEEYYQPTSQSDEDCFYVPEVNPDAAPIFRGQCQEIGGMAGFDSQRYLGWWHEIERYPVDNSAGECISSEYTLGSTTNTFNVVNTTVNNGIATVTTGNVVVSNNGRLVKTFSDGTTQEIWVLATDYETYSLLYSCENINDEYRLVWSAKHSKTRSLTTAAQTAMASAIDSNQVLYPQFFQSVDQSDDACFHYPEQSGDEVILPGQCNDNIAVVQNFDFAAFAGTWYEIESYEDAGEKSCIGLRFTLQPNSDFVDVLSFYNVDGQLRSYIGETVVLPLDNSGVLNLTLVMQESEGDRDLVYRIVRVLDTDYENYAVFLSCANINDFQRKLHVTKLSRERSLSAESNTSINQLITRTPELHQPYFKQTPHNENCLEPSSAHLVKSSVIVILICALLKMML